MNNYSTLYKQHGINSDDYLMMNGCLNVDEYKSNNELISLNKTKTILEIEDK